jgi:GNAT superfamily N-acetyltransferase
MIVLRKAKEDDIRGIREIAKTTCTPTYVPIIGQSQVDYMLEKIYSDGVLLEDMMKGSIFLIAEVDGRDMGFACYSITDPENYIYKLHKLYVLPEAHGQSIGKFLMNEIVNKARKAGGKILELNVNRKNKAKGFYEKAGFKIKESVDIPIGNGFFMNDYIMSLTL